MAQNLLQNPSLACCVSPRRQTRVQPHSISVCAVGRAISATDAQGCEAITYNSTALSARLLSMHMYKRCQEMFILDAQLVSKSTWLQRERPRKAEGGILADPKPRASSEAAGTQCLTAPAAGCCPATSAPAYLEMAMCCASPEARVLLAHMARQGEVRAAGTART